MGDFSSNLDKTKPSFNLWNDARFSPQVTSTISRIPDFARLKIFDVMSTRSYNRDSADIRSENYYDTTNKTSLNCAKANNSILPSYSINTMHLQDSYRAPRRLEGYAPRIMKETQRSQDTFLRWRYGNNLMAKRETIVNKNSDHENEKFEKSKKKKKNQAVSEFTELAKQYCSNTGLHGLRYVGNSELSIVERIFWMIAFICALITAIYYSCYLYQKWNNAPIIISLSPEPISLNEFPFPSITICNMNHVKKTEAKRIEHGSDELDKFLLEDICNSESNISYSNEQGVIDWDKMLRFMINVSQPCTDMLYYCQWRGNQTDCEKIFNPTMTDEGICCNFNAVNRKYLFYNAREWPDLNITFPFVSVDWNAENGYNINTPTDAVPRRSYGAGQYYGLTLVLDVDTREYYCSSTASVGFKMVLHNPVETPKIADFSFSITPGEETRVFVTPRISTASKKIISISQKKRKCFFTFERKLRYYRTYTQRNCIMECEANFTQKICECVQYYMPKSANTTICGKKDEQCAKEVKRAMEMKIYGEDSTNLFNVSKIPSCNCWPGCSEISYSMELSQSKLLSTFNVDKRYVKKDINYFTENMAVVHLFFVDSQFTKYVKTELFGFIEFLSSTGGLLSLFMGFSFLSFMEIVYFFTMRLCCRLCNHRESSGPTMLQIHSLDHRKKMIYPFAN